MRDVACELLPSRSRLLLHTKASQLLGVRSTMKLVLSIKFDATYKQSLT